MIELLKPLLTLPQLVDLIIFFLFFVVVISIGIYADWRQERKIVKSVLRYGLYPGREADDW